MSPVPTRKCPVTNRKFAWSSERYTNRMLQRILPDGAWENKPCFIVGGGPSLRDFDWSLLKGYRTIGVNRAYEKYDPTIIFSMDTRFLRWILDGIYGPEAKMKFERSKAYKVWLCTYRARLPEEIFIVKVYRNYTKGFKAFNFSMSEGLGHGNNSGYAALNLACCLRANPIYLLGFDMRHEKKRREEQPESERVEFLNKRANEKRDRSVMTHWHSGHPRPQTQMILNNFIKYFTEVAPKIEREKISVVNLCPNSKLECFPRKSWEEVLH